MNLPLEVHQTLCRDLHADDLYEFRGARGDLTEIIWHDGVGVSLSPGHVDQPAPR